MSSNNIRRNINLSENGTEGLIVEFNNLDTQIQEVDVKAEKAISIATETQKMEGQPGKTPVKGVDYFDGEPGKDYTLTDEDKKEIASTIEVPVVEKVIEKTVKVIRETPIVTEITKEVLPDDIAEKLNTLESAIDVSVIKGAVSKNDLSNQDKKVLDGMAKIDGRIKAIDQRWRGAGLSKVTHDNTLTGSGTPSDPLHVLGASPLTTKGDIYGHSTVDARVPVGTDGDVLTADSTNPLGVSYKTPTAAPVSSVSNSDGTLTISPTTGAVVASLNLAHLNNWTAEQDFNIVEPTNSFLTPPTTATRNDFTGVVGMTFTVSSNVTVNKLGRLFVAGNTHNHGINLWISTNTVTPIATGTILVASASDSQGFKWVSVTPVTLTPGNTYAIGTDETNGQDTWVSPGGQDYVPTLQAPFTDTFSCFSGTPGAYPGNNFNIGKLFSSPAMQYNATYTTTIAAGITTSSVNAGVFLGSTMNLLSTGNFFQLGYDTLNFIKYTVGSTGNVAMNLNGTNPIFTMNTTLSVSNSANNSTRVLTLNQQTSNNLDFEMQMAGTLKWLQTVRNGAFDFWLYNGSLGTSAITLLLSNNFVGINTTAPATQLHVIKTTEQLRLGYDTSNYQSLTVNSTGSVTYALTGTTPTFTFSQVIIPSGGIKGTTTNNNATALNVGEYVSNSIVQGSALALTTATPLTVTSISLTAGDWDITAIGALTGASTGTVFDVAIGTTTNSFTGTVLGDTRCETPTVSLTGADASLMIPAVRVSISATTTYYLIVSETFTIGTPAAYGRISARRVR